MFVYMSGNNSSPFRNGLWVGHRFLFKRMSNRRGVPEEMISNKFVGANEELRELAKQMTKDIKLMRV